MLQSYDNEEGNMEDDNDYAPLIIDTHSSPDKALEQAQVNGTPEVKPEIDALSIKPVEKPLSPTKQTSSNIEENNNIVGQNTKTVLSEMCTPKNTCHHDFAAPLSTEITPSTPTSRTNQMLNSPAPSTGSTHSTRSSECGSSTRSKISQPSKARKKSDKV